MGAAVIFLILVAAAIWIAGVLWQHVHYERPRQALRENPPHREVAELRTARGTANSKERMQQALTHLAREIKGASKAERLAGEKTITLDIRVEPGPGVSERARFLFATDPSASKPARRALTTAYKAKQSDLAIVDVPDLLLAAGLTLREAQTKTSVFD